MSHEDSGHYAAKHAPGTQLNPQIAELIKQRTSQGKITCSDAHRIAHELDVPPAEVGVTIDLLEIKLSRCQLGLFGYGQKKRIVRPAEHVSPEVKDALERSPNEADLESHIENHDLGLMNDLSQTRGKHHLIEAFPKLQPDRRIHPMRPDRVMKRRLVSQVEIPS